MLDSLPAPATGSTSYLELGLGLPSPPIYPSPRARMSERAGRARSVESGVGGTSAFPSDRTCDRTSDWRSLALHRPSGLPFPVVCVLAPPAGDG